MSRIGNKLIPVPKGVKVDIQGAKVVVTGPKGKLEREIRPEVSIKEEDGNLVLMTQDESKRSMAMKGLTRSLVNNMVVGVDTGFQKKLIVEGVGYRVTVEGSALTLNVGYSNPVNFKLPAGVSATMVDKVNTVMLESIDKELLGVTAAKVREIRKPEPYKGKGIRYEGEHIVRKVGKSAAKG
ncbi:MAG: 50S ribosomal protein L6 [Desulfobulbaceae bacterium]|jgi:large subunit ribosomal protein L6|nr:50S ribosomal protein L6 [Desulfobulbaceae bacterium]MDH3541084.1 50S ribosomal protein L6 [Desulfobulbaceae bacterium]MDH3775576.1 50S ribosomal protein L6 [Desulfobulbaceae bacterium]MDH3781241.1 50S ribosomal protein L6 [Desulfobulbaceae bacterium]MDH3865959.1 50S ribosomal protein L6 [Desulfobulbaceae bacterium]